MSELNDFNIGDLVVPLEDPQLYGIGTVESKNHTYITVRFSKEKNVFGFLKEGGSRSIHPRDLYLIPKEARSVSGIIFDIAQIISASYDLQTRQAIRSTVGRL